MLNPPGIPVVNPNPPLPVYSIGSVHWKLHSIHRVGKPHPAGWVASIGHFAPRPSTRPQNMMTEVFSSCCSFQTKVWKAARLAALSTVKVVHLATHVSIGVPPLGHKKKFKCHFLAQWHFSQKRQTPEIQMIHVHPCLPNSTHGRAMVYQSTRHRKLEGAIYACYCQDLHVRCFWGGQLLKKMIIVQECPIKDGCSSSFQTSGMGFYRGKMIHHHVHLWALKCTPSCVRHYTLGALFSHNPPKKPPQKFKI